MSTDTRWLSNFRVTNLWGSADANDYLLKLSQFSRVRQEAEQAGSRIRVFYSGRENVPAMTGFVSAADLGPIDAPADMPPTQPDFSNRAPEGGGPFLSNHRVTALFAGPSGNATIIDEMPKFSVFAQLMKQNGPRIYAYYYGNNTIPATSGWLLAEDLGPVPEPASFPPPEPLSDGIINQADPGLWTLDLGRAIADEDLWDPNGQPQRKTAMIAFNQLPFTRRRDIFESALAAGLSAEQITSQSSRESWAGAMRLVVRGGPSQFGSVTPENGDLNPFILAGESGGVFRGGADVLNSAALGYFQFIATNPNGTDFGHWSRFMADHERAFITNPTSQVQEFIRAIRASFKHHGDPWSVVREKALTGVWGP